MYVLATLLVSAVSINSTNYAFRGFMIQARASSDGDPIGAFTAVADGKQQTMYCDSENVSNARANRVAVAESVLLVVNSYLLFL